MKITIWHNSGTGTETTADDFSHIEVDGKTVWVAETNCPRHPQDEPFCDEATCFQRELKKLINRYSMENGSNTPDFILAEYLGECLKTFDKVTKGRDKWYNIPTEKEFQLK
jgi:hypothetical protein